MEAAERQRFVKTHWKSRSLTQSHSFWMAGRREERRRFSLVRRRDGEMMCSLRGLRRRMEEEEVTPHILQSSSSSKEGAGQPAFCTGNGLIMCWVWAAKKRGTTIVQRRSRLPTGCQKRNQNILHTQFRCLKAKTAINVRSGTQSSNGQRDIRTTRRRPMPLSPP